jgi:hypothetical protein
MVIDYDFRLGKSHLRGAGPRGLAALAIVFASRAALVCLIAFSAKPAGIWLVQLLRHLV